MAGDVLLDIRSLQGPGALRGVGRYAAGLLRALDEDGFEFAVLIDEALPEPDLPAGVQSVYTTRRRWHGRLAAYEDAVALQRDLARIRPRLYHALHLTLPGRSPCPVAVTVHDLIPWAFKGWRMAGERFRYRPPRRLLPRAELCLAVSEATKRDLLHLAGVDEARVRVVYEGLDPSFQPQPGAEQRVKQRWGLEAGRYFVFVGALDVRKDPRGLLRAWSAARAAGADFPLVIAGDPGRQAPPDMGGARLLGHVPDDGLADLLSAAGCLIFPSLYEGFGLPPLEAMGCGCPVAAYRNSSLPEVVDGAGELVATGGAAELGRAAARLVLDDKARSTARSKGLEQARRFTWRKAARATIAAYDLALRNNHGPS